jgi:hypothetical protein
MLFWKSDERTLYGTEYWIINIVIKKYGSSTFWREYSLKDRAGNNVYLSESDGHWVLLRPIDFAFKEYQYYAEADGRITDGMKLLLVQYMQLLVFLKINYHSG